MFFLSLIIFSAGTEIRDFTSVGKNKTAFITGLTLALTDAATCDDTMYTAACAPVYYVCAKAMNKAGAESNVICSSPIRTVEQDRAGENYLCHRIRQGEARFPILQHKHITKIRSLPLKITLNLLTIHCLIIVIK